ncbi:translocation protein SEC62 [Episyrphus balteatus]|uniref:translocation protein SEC62 n=1 Tax=Episyrphus balteatus TaxID=286459 RepID=UPI002486BD5E|nr:translocation protein SEC62 [Episyrphus balteatus]
MSEKKKSRRRKDEYIGPGEQDTDQPTKQEYKIAKWLRSNVKTKKTKFLSHNVEYFTANKAVDALMKSKFAIGEDSLFPTREHAITMLDTMLEHKFFHRAKKVPVCIDELRSGKSSKPKDTSSKDVKEPTDEKLKNEKAEKGSGVEKVTDAENGNAEVGTPTDELQGKEKRKRKIRLDMHPEQVFVDGSEAYVWIYDPIPIHYWIYGLILLLGAIVICLFPLWPLVLRKGVYYLSVAAAGFLVFILALTVIRLVIFTLVWVVTAAKWHFWIFPNLTEDVGFFASFWPLYESKYVSDQIKGKNDKKLKKKKKERDSDDGEDAAGDVPPLEPEIIEQIKENDAEMLLRQRKTNISNGAENSGGESSDCQQDISNSKGTRTSSEESDGSELAGKDYEIINPGDVPIVN